MFLNNLCNTLEQLLDLLVEVTDMQTQGSGNIRPACLLESITLLGRILDQLISQEQIVDGIGLG